MRFLAAVVRWIERTACVCLVAALVVVLLFTFGQVLDRYLVRSSFDAHDQLARIGLVWATFIGVALGFRERRTIRIELIDRLLPPRLLRVREVLFDLLILVMLVVIHWKGWRVYFVTMNQNIIGTPFTQAVSSAAMLVGSVLYGLFVLLRIGRALGLPLPDRDPAPEPGDAPEGDGPAGEKAGG